MNNKENHDPLQILGEMIGCLDSPDLKAMSFKMDDLRKQLNYMEDGSLQGVDFDYDVCGQSCIEAAKNITNEFRKYAVEEAKKLYKRLVLKDMIESVKSDKPSRLLMLVRMDNLTKGFSVGEDGSLQGLDRLYDWCGRVCIAAMHSVTREHRDICLRHVEQWYRRLIAA